MMIHMEECLQRCTAQCFDASLRKLPLSRLHSGDSLGVKGCTKEVLKKVIDGCNGGRENAAAAFHCKAGGLADLADEMLPHPVLRFCFASVH